MKAQPDEPVVWCRDLFFSYGDVPVLEAVSLTIDPLDSVCIVGPNGGGKTTLVRLFLGLLEPQRGSVRLFGHPPHAGLRRVGYVPQHSHFDPKFPVSVLDVVLMGRLGPAFWYSRNDRRQALAALERLHLDGFHDRPFAELSGGQRQRVCIARALASDCDLLVLDEPAAYIDPAAEQSLFHLLEQLNQRMTIVVVTHDLGFASRFFRRVICVNRRVVIHPTSDITGRAIRDIYGADIRMIRHDHRCAEDGHEHDGG